MQSCHSCISSMANWNSEMSEDGSIHAVIPKGIRKPCSHNPQGPKIAEYMSKSDMEKKHKKILLTAHACKLTRFLFQGASWVGRTEHLKSTHSIWNCFLWQPPKGFDKLIILKFRKEQSKEIDLGCKETPFLFEMEVWKRWMLLCCISNKLVTEKRHQFLMKVFDALWTSFGIKAHYKRFAFLRRKKMQKLKPCKWTLFITTMLKKKNSVLFVQPPARASFSFMLGRDKLRSLEEPKNFSRRIIRSIKCVGDKILEFQIGFLDVCVEREIY